MKFVVIAVLLLLHLSVCSQNLSESSWQLMSIDDLETGISKDIAATAKATLRFEGDSSYSGRFCNTYKGNYKHNQDKIIRMGVPQATRMLCMGIDKYEKEMFALMVMVNRYRMEDDKLFLFTTNHKRLSYKKTK
ncbi:MAG: META domain-containing protein [Bacteroidia bacterium]|nr:META domain-containing protein [Bacteroidia bacterium]